MPPTTGNSGIENNITRFLGTYGMGKEKKPTEEFITCPNCNGFGQVRG